MYAQNCSVIHCLSLNHEINTREDFIQTSKNLKQIHLVLFTLYYRKDTLRFCRIRATVVVKMASKSKSDSK